MIGFDCNTKLTPETAKAFRADGYEFVMRYVGRLVQKPHDLDKCEADLIRAAGLKLGIVQHVAVRWKPTVSLGQTYGRNAGLFAKECGYAPGAVIYLDLEDIVPGIKSDLILKYCNAWYDEIKIAGFTPGIYIGFNSWLTSEELYYGLKFRHYWRSMSRVPDVARRGYAMLQGHQIRKHGILIDPDEARPDRLGGFPPFME